ncbi:MAG: dienelactone hydrolase family protein [Pigmentiphaga sp.]
MAFMTYRDQPNSTPLGVREKNLVCEIEDRLVPATVWLPDCEAPRPLVLVGHGGSGHKRSQLVLDIVEVLAKRHGYVVAAMDGPVHGDRKNAKAVPDEARSAFRQLWEQGGSVEAMVADWNEVLACVAGFQEVDASRVGYYGLSMGTAYGLPFVAQQDGIHAAVFGMWGTSRANSQRLLQDASRVRIPVLFALQWDDPLFSREGQFEIFDAFGTDDRRMHIHPGGHVDPDARRLSEIEHFLTLQLSHRA